MSRPSSFYEAYRKNRALFLSVVLMPLVGMIAVIPIVLLRAPKNQLIVIAFTFFLIVQYQSLSSSWSRGSSAYATSPPPFNPNRNRPNLPGNTLLPVARMQLRMVVSYTLARVLPAQDKAVYDELIALDEVKGVVLAYGVFDMMITIETENIEELDDIVFNKIRKIGGIDSTTTLISAKKEE